MLAGVTGIFTFAPTLFQGIGFTRRMMSRSSVIQEINSRMSANDTTTGEVGEWLKPHVC
jgi:hypothetical protein